MKYLLDTHALLWICEDSSALSPPVRSLVTNEKTELYLSVVSIWEMAIKISIGKLVLPGALSNFVQDEVSGNMIKILPLNAPHLLALERLPFFHRDPFDRAIICQAAYEGMTVVSRDSAFRKYDVPVFW